MKWETCKKAADATPTYATVETCGEPEEGKQFMFAGVTASTVCGDLRDGVLEDKTSAEQAAAEQAAAEQAAAEAAAAEAAAEAAAAQQAALEALGAGPLRSGFEAGLDASHAPPARPSPPAMPTAPPSASGSRRGARRGARRRQHAAAASDRRPFAALSSLSSPARAPLFSNRRKFKNVLTCAEPVSVKLSN